MCFTTASFEVTVNGKLIFSKLAQGSFPSFKEVGIDLRYNKGATVQGRSEKKEILQGHGNFFPSGNFEKCL